MRPARPVAAIGAAAAVALALALLLGAAALVLVATEQTGAAAAGAWLAATAAGAGAIGVAGVGFTVFRSVRAAQVRAERTAARLRSLDRNATALTSSVSDIDRRLADVGRQVADIERRTVEIERSQLDMHATQRADLAALSDHLVDEHSLDQKLRTSARSLRSAITSSAEHSFWRTQGLLSLYQSLDIERGLPPMRSWAVAPDLAAHLVDMVRDRTPLHVVETGSGVSTVLLALTLRRNGHGHVTALEHDPAFAEETRRLLANYGVADFATVLECPLESVAVGAEEHRWYSIDVETLSPIDLLFVDGPPQSVGPLSRFPAVPVLAQILSPDCVIVLDDAAREDEKTIAERWCHEFGLRQDPPLQHERGTIVLRPGSQAVHGQVPEVG